MIKAPQSHIGFSASVQSFMNAVTVEGSELARLPWWVDPAKLITFFIIPLYIFVYCIPLVFGKGAIRLRFLDYFSWGYFGLGLLFLVVLANGALIGGLTLGRQPRPSRIYWVSSGFMDFLAIVSILAYLIWFHRVLINPLFWVTLLTGKAHAAGMARGGNPLIPGVTSAVQFALAYMVLYTLVTLSNARDRIPRRFMVYFGVVLGLTVFRVFAWGERLALVEAIIPLALVSALGGRPKFVFRHRFLVSVMPFVGVVFLILFFALAEFYRSWLAHYQSRGGDFWVFALSRLATYYYTALNNGAGMLRLLEWPTWSFATLFSWLYRFPILGTIISFAGGRHDIEAETYLLRFGDAEFNNLSGIFPVFYDLGIAGGLLFALGWGAFMGYLFRTFRDRSGLGLFLYPVVYIAVLEVMRYAYLSASRAFPAIAIVLIGYLLFIRRNSHEREDLTNQKRFLKIQIGGTEETRYAPAESLEPIGRRSGLNPRASS